MSDAELRRTRAGRPVWHYRAVGSTNDTAAELARMQGEMDRSPCWVIADHQTAGRGRRGRAWSDHADNFSGTLLWPLAPEHGRTPALFSFLAALAIVDSFEAVGIPRTIIGLKWPNDVLLEGGKVCGILVETVAGLEGLMAATIGIGVNLAQVPPHAPPEGRALSQWITPPPPTAFLETLDARFDEWWAIYGAHGFSRIRSAWLERATGLNQALVVRLSDRTLEGIFRGLDKDGALLLEHQGEVTRFLAGDVFLRRQTA
ncbi:biotin protein ligase [Parvularcula bermudensis HTCC2503]|uniref:biotin--[biotin carboxyl-carrier protein] ligase n=1 Tax=Parvularcula bermudensis (strain ATCC BAA-594 / HTCC2503 / KCTC 12087) TaxID=314260 RepID=E0TDV4_PARBH|nr:biotin--[acetyl-CoA-carboxylase] ligase [Parvularcula bermudensis]ADM10403.1 biotin protein ligase [Parvularcula bermudensis HTCC2503]